MNGEVDPRPLSYATSETDVSRSRDEPLARACFRSGLFAPLLMLIFAVLGGAVGALLSPGGPPRARLAAARTLATIFTYIVPLSGLAIGLVALSRTLGRPSRNHWQVIAGLTIHAVLCIVAGFVLYHTLY